MNTGAMYNRNTKKENILAVVGISLLLPIFISKYELLQQVSALMIIVLTAFLLKFKFTLIGGVSLFFASLALLVYPFLYSPVYMLIPGASVSALAGFFILINWWYKNKDVSQS